MSENEFEKVTSEIEVEAEVTAPIETEEEQTVEEMNEVVEETTEEVVEDDTIDEVCEASDECQEVEITEDVVEKKKSKAPAIIAIVAIIVVALVAYVLYDAFGGNKYNKLGYANPNGRTVADVCEDLGITIDEFKTNYKLPEDMPEDTEEMAAYYSIPVSVFAQMYGIDYATFKETYKIPEETTPSKPASFIGKIKALFGVYDIQPIDENTPWGIVLDELTLGNYVGEHNLDTFKEYYGITDEAITSETKYKDVRELVEAKEVEMYEEAKKAEEQAANEESENADVAVDDVVESEPETTEETPTEE